MGWTDRQRFPRSSLPVHQVCAKAGTFRLTSYPFSNLTAGGDSGGSRCALPPPGLERNKYFIEAITGCVAAVLQLDSSDVDCRAASPDPGMDFQ